MANQKKSAGFVLKEYIATVCIVLLVVGAVALFASLGGSSKGGGGGNISSSESSSEEKYLVPIYSSTDFSQSNGFVYRPSSVSKGGITIVEEQFVYTKSEAASGSGESVIFLPYEEAAKADSVVATFDIYIDSSMKMSNPMSYQITFNELAKSPFIGTIRTRSDGFLFGRMARNTGNDVLADVTSVLEYDTWHTIKIEMDLSSEEEFNVTFYADGEVIGTSDVFNKTNTTDLKTEIKGLYFQVNSSVTSMLKLDNISLYTLALAE